MNKKTIISIVLVLLITACNNETDKKTQLVGEWQAFQLENPKLQEMMDEQTAFLDTFGRNSSDQQNIEVYGFSNIDSARDVLKQEMVEYMAMQDHAVKNTKFNFREDGLVIMDFSGQVDSTRWSLSEQGNLVLEPTGDDDQQISMEVLYLTDSILKLQLNEQGMSSTVIFKPADK